MLETGSATSSNITATNGLYGAYGGGVQFPATQVASSNANTLDDYEEGTWTPTLKDTNGGTANVLKYSQRSGRYQIIGNLLYIQFNIQLDGTSGATGTLSSAGGLQIGNLPLSGVTGLQMASLYLYQGWVGSFLKGATTTYASGGNFTEIVNNGSNMNGGNVANDFYMWGGMVLTSN